MQFAILAKLTKVHKLMSFDIRLLYILIISFLTPLANPSTYKIFLLPFQLLKFSAYIKEWKPFPANSWWFIFYLIFVLITIISFLGEKILFQSKISWKNYYWYLLYKICFLLMFFHYIWILCFFSKSKIKVILEDVM